MAIELNSLNLKKLRRAQIQNVCCAHRLAKGAPAHRVTFHDHGFLYFLGGLERSDLTRGFGPRLGIFLDLDRIVPLGDWDMKRVGLSNKGGSFLRNRKSRGAW